MVAPPPKRLLRTRSRICAVSISGDYVHDGRAPLRTARADHTESNSLIVFKTRRSGA
jgi:hypothetical protein